MLVPRLAVCFLMVASSWSLCSCGDDAGTAADGVVQDATVQPRHGGIMLEREPGQPHAEVTQDYAKYRVMLYLTTDGKTPAPTTQNPALNFRHDDRLIRVGGQKKGEGVWLFEHAYMDKHPGVARIRFETKEGIFRPLIPPPEKP